MLFTEPQDADIWLDEHPAYQQGIYLDHSGSVILGEQPNADWDEITRRELLEICCS